MASYPGPDLLSVSESELHAGFGGRAVPVKLDFDIVRADEGVPEPNYWSYKAHHELVSWLR
ncbi:MAG: hypothetical protein JOZ19_08960 [Rubrobacter sp.]|nr:hypothetical protein [Rubrobacter sp.]